jgi:chemotaxis protein CheD
MIVAPFNHTDHTDCTDPADHTGHAAQASHEPLYVASGQLRVGRGSEVLTTLLGSCVGIALLWKKGGRCALAHCLLPEGPHGALRFGARYVNHAVPSLLALLGAGREDYADIEVIVAGGASMLGRMRASAMVGDQNATAAQRCLSESGLRVSFIDVGGKCGRKLSVDCAHQSYNIVKVERIAEEAHGHH